jgi:hypothetical protein
MRMAIARVVTSLFWLLTAVYALLSAIPFASQHLLEPGLVPALALFARWHGWLSLFSLAAAAAALQPWLRAGHRRVWSFIGTCAAGALIAILTSGLDSLEPTPLALIVSLASLVPPVWLALLDLGAPAVDHAVPLDSGLQTDFAACLGAASVVTVVHAGGSVMLGGTPAGWLTSFGRSALLHVLAFCAIFAAISVIRGVAAFSRRPVEAETWLARGVFAAILGVVLDRVVLSGLAFTGGPAVIVAAAYAVALALVVGPRGGAPARGVETALAGCVPGWAAGSTAAACSWLALVMGGVIAAERAVAGSDWNFTVAKLIAVASWSVALATALRVTPRVLPARSARPMWAAVPFGACGLALFAHQQVAATAWSESPVAVDASSRLIADAITPASPTDSGLYQLLQNNTNIAHSVHVDPVSVDFATAKGPSARRPHVFLFVIDSLRRDYLSPYNDEVTFTPAFARFAQESTVFDRAFTRYGATGLAVPSIWVGGLVLHKQYVTPFAPMNALAKLLRAEDYRQWITMEHIVETIVPPSAAIDPLDVGVAVKDHRFCRTLTEVRGRLDRLGAQGQPTFVYSLPQDVHVATITREGAASVDDGDYRGFNAAYASRVRRFDACFGAFVGDLKARGLYDDSVIIVMSDHGDSLGEQGRMGHAYTIFPEIIQVPLIVHLPADFAAAYSSSPRSPAFTSDITPSLYALLGHSPKRPAPIFGQPLFRRAGDATPERSGPQVVASSYGSVYGALLDDARRLYIIDAVSFREHAYDLDGSGAGRVIDVRDGDRQTAQRAVRDVVGQIAEFYGYQSN